MASGVMVSNGDLPLVMVYLLSRGITIDDKSRLVIRALVSTNSRYKITPFIIKYQIGTTLVQLYQLPELTFNTLRSIPFFRSKPLVTMVSVS